ncbi:hypothetical protein CCHR01_02310 [Colletotrichum chrysophilum]|uniref:Uncharacterized protein n=1 Tax=Colletotrichum chrysophilum TaxID=1836956 RepID=A0AAD9AYI9_9PEZI|nr:hypothetical protein CCHR01_02310 [Colletotrichum chrysophilum]
MLAQFRLTKQGDTAQKQIRKASRDHIVAVEVNTIEPVAGASGTGVGIAVGGWAFDNTLDGVRSHEYSRRPASVLSPLRVSRPPCHRAGEETGRPTASVRIAPRQASQAVSFPVSPHFRADPCPSGWVRDPQTLTGRTVDGIFIASFVFISQRAPSRTAFYASHAGRGQSIAIVTESDSDDSTIRERVPSRFMLLFKIA